MSTFSLLRRFLRRTDGSVPIEGLFGALLLLTWYALSFQIYEAFRMKTLHQRAAYTIADMISRQDTAIGPKFVQGLKTTFTYLTDAKTTDDSWVRITLIECMADGADDKDPCDGVTKHATLLESYATDSEQTLTQANIEALFDRIPIMAMGDTAVITETSSYFDPIFSMAERDLIIDGRNSWSSMFLPKNLHLRNFVVTRPRGMRNTWDDNA
ncbi:hypothetical protein [Paenirhodobacter sp. CAU 1674]|uniref:TadE/TadG family type IV pilus assembly protein n=1 Tax=Paenirhodobacter sp. CAU 1674 TaxID=3032596 RepID=UPI0023DC4860|nr:hypothetical protein [Paenirhodobacter sp. CAU 1674]MDF2141588.1 hypothetical protein [Paenirhodobacter sp. CAU 1674]